MGTHALTLCVASVPARRGASEFVFPRRACEQDSIYGHGAPVKGVVPTNDRYMAYEKTAIEIAKFFRTQKRPVSRDETIELFTFLEAAEGSN